jgi:uncharacterized membrane protein YphA (DoxX/SURF4 family)
LLVHRLGYPDSAGGDIRTDLTFVVGLAELSGAILLLIPRLARFGALLLIAVMVGATATHLIHHEPQVVTTLVLLALLGVVSSSPKIVDVYFWK